MRDVRKKNSDLWFVMIGGSHNVALELWASVARREDRGVSGWENNETRTMFSLLHRH